MKKLSYALIVAASPIMALAANSNISPDTSGITSLIDTVKTIVQTLVPILMTLALLAFILGLVKYISSAGDAKKASEGKSIMIYGVLALFVMASVWGLTAFLQNVFGIDSSATAPSSSDLTPQ